MNRQIAGVCTLAAVVAAAALPMTAAQAADELAAPTFSQDGGRYTESTTVELAAPEGAQIRYTLDGSMPTAESPLYEKPLVVDETTNIAATSVKGDAVSPAEIEGYIVKSDEKPLLSFFVMSDIHTSQLNEKSRGIWKSHFDTLASINPDPDLIISNGDQINDNNWNTAPDHQVVKTILDENMARLDIEDTPILMSHGNHDVGNADMAQYYGDWFPNATGGYYEKTIGGSTFLVIDTERYSGAQRSWLQQRLAALSAEGEALDTPVFVVGHRPASGTVHDGAQSSNGDLTEDLAAHPQVVYFSGHSHLHLNDERSIWQDGFTAVNDGSMSYTETPHDVYQSDGNALWEEFTIPTAQALYVEVYDDRTEIDRVNFAAENERTYADGQWGAYQDDYPFASAGTLAGPTWTVRLEGSTPDEVRENFDYTSAARDTVAPSLDGTPAHILVDGKDVLRVPAATDDESVYGYDVKVTDAATGALGLPIRAGAKVLADFQMAPRPSILNIPLAIGNRSQSDAEPVSLTRGTEYVAEVAAVDMYGNRSEPKKVEFVAGEDAAALPSRLKLTTADADLIPGEATTVTTTFTNQSGATMTDVSVALNVPEGWNAFATGDSNFKKLKNEEERAIEWVVVPTTDVAAGRHTLAGEATYTSAGETGSITRRTALTTLADGEVPSSRLSIAGFSSQGAGADEAAANAIDGNPASLWHTQYAVAPPADFPHWITLDLGSEHVLDGLRYLPRQTGTNGNLKGYEIHVSNDNEQWGDPVAAGSFSTGTGSKQVDFAEVRGRYIRLTGISAHNGLAFGAAAELTPLGHLAAQRPEATVTAETSTAGGKVKLSVSVTNDDSEPVDANVLTAFGAHEFTGVRPGETVSRTFQTKQSTIAAGVAVVELTTEIDGEAVTRFAVADHAAGDAVRPQVSLVSPTTAGPSPVLDIQVDATDEVGLERIVANMYQKGKVVKSTQSAVEGTSGSHNAMVTLPDGEYTVKYNAKDAAGNVSKTSTFDVVIDATAPTVTVKTEVSATVGDEAGYETVSFKLHDARKIDRVEINGVVKDLSDNPWSDVNFVRPGVFGAVTGANTLVAYDVAGNSTTVEFTLR
ncbi:discoidin domain-containing protein [Microbacterium sp. H1-D42]|uniref:discoidin domain-containing protein n=1 Tax=Microbacterium sp. H1-D42 TaxID=2925844 RepID=UPI001F53862F|nr:discoidin domain-containing protein [Microbacterium sp. H1-D42]UNK70669.1 discoidin domain-containing protein [Microbacterium sp. H1-D42]